MKDFIRKYKTNIILVLILSFSVYLFILLRSEKNMEEIKDVIKNIRLRYIWLVLLIFAVYTILESVVLYMFTKQKVKGFKFRNLIRLNLTTQFFNAVTPFASGGQPYQIFYFNARGIKVKDSSSIVLMNFITFQIAIDILGLLALIFKYDYFNRIVLDGKGYLLLIGFGVNIFMTVLIFILAFSKKIYHLIFEVIWMRMINWPFLRRFNFSSSTVKFKETINDMNHEIKELNNHKFLWIKSVFLHMVRISLLYSIPIFLFMALGQEIREDQILNLLIGTFFVAMVMAYIPSPGASGGAEGLFAIIFFTFFPNESIITVALLLWRFVTYYLYLIIGFISLITSKYPKDLAEINYGEEVEVAEVKLKENLEVV